MKRILVTNDDGYGAPGLEVLARVLEEQGYTVFIAAPNVEKSAASHAITVRRSMLLDWYAPNRVAIDGFPADCVNIILNEQMFPGVDLVLSGINRGPNMGLDVIYSGTVAGARQGYIQGVPAMALSLNKPEATEQDFVAGAEWLLRILEETADLPEPFLLSLNIPPGQEIKGYRFTELGRREYRDRYVPLKSASMQELFGQGDSGHSLPVEVAIEGKTVHSDTSGETDFLAVDEGFISITPLALNQTDFILLNRLKERDYQRQMDLS
jgi:5'-nucleotidase